MDFERDRSKQPSATHDARSGHTPAPAPRTDRLRQGTRGGFEQARGALGFSDREPAAAFGVTPDASALRPHVPVPGVLADLAGGGLLAGGGALDLFDSELERRRRAREQRTVDKLRQGAPELRSVGEALGAAADHPLANAQALGALDRGFRPVTASPRGAFSGSVELALGGNGRRIDVGTGEVAGLVHFALENGVPWVYDEIDKARAWAERQRRSLSEQRAPGDGAGPDPTPLT